jgi:hypothetical protein
MQSRLCVQVPLQQNDFDCGLFLLHSLETFVTTAPATFRLADLSSTLQVSSLLRLQPLGWRLNPPDCDSMHKLQRALEIQF